MLVEIIGLNLITVATLISVIVLYELRTDIPSYPFTGLGRPLGLQEFEAPQTFQKIST